MSSKRLGLIALLLTAIVVAACAPATDQSQVATLQAQLAEAQKAAGAGGGGAANADQVATLQAQLAAAQAAGAGGTQMPTFNPEFKNADTITYMDIGDPDSLDPAYDYETTGAAMINNMYDTLVFFKGSSVNDYAPMLATDWKVSADGKTYTFTIRKGVTFHDGGTLEPHDVAYTFARDMLTGFNADNDGPESLLLQVFFGVTAVDDVAKGDDAICDTVSKAIVADDTAGTVTMTLKQPAAYFLQIVGANSFGAILDKEFMVKNGAWDGDCKTWRKSIPADKSKATLATIENGTGPYKLDHWKTGDELVMVANDKWWVTAPLYDGSTVKGVPPVKNIVVKVVPEWSTRLAALQAGDADKISVLSQFYDQIDPMVKEQIEYGSTDVATKNPNGSLRMYHGLPQGLTADIFFNWKVDTTGGNALLGSGKLDGAGITPDFFSDVHVRKAFNYCFNRDTYIKEVNKGEAVPHRGPIPVGLPGYDANSTIYGFDVDKCADELKQAWGGQVAEKGFTVTMVYNSGNDNRRIALEILRDGLAAANAKLAGGDRSKQNITVSIVSMAWPPYLAARNKGRLPLYVIGWLEDFHDSWDWVHPYMSCGGDFSGAQGIPAEMCGAWDKLMSEAVTSTDAAKAAANYTQLQKESIDQAIDIFNSQPTVREYEQLWIHGWYYRPLFDEPYWAALTKSK